MGSRGVPPSQIPGSAGCPHPEGGTPQSEGGTGQNGTKTGPNRPKMRFGAILDHLDATFIHFGPFGRLFFFFDFEVILADLGPFGAFQPYGAGVRRLLLSLR